MKGYKSSEKVVDSSSSEDESPVHSPTLIRRSRSPPSSSRRSSSSSSSSSSPLISGTPSNSPSRSPSPDLSSYRYQPPSTHTLSTSKEKSALPTLRQHEELFLLRIPKGVNLDSAQFNFRKRKVRIGEEEWKLLDEETGDVKVIQPQENSEKFEFGAMRFSMGLNVVRDVQIPIVNGKAPEEAVEKREKKRKRDKEDTDKEKRRKHGEDKDKEKKNRHHDKDKSESKEKVRDKDKKSHKEKHHKSDKDGKQKNEKHKHQHP